jgi:hypothetical protein
MCKHLLVQKRYVEITREREENKNGRTRQDKDGMALRKGDRAR